MRESSVELMPCQIKDCINVGAYEVSSDTNRIQVCATHALEIAELHRDEPK